MKTFEDLYFVITAIWGFSPFLAIVVFALDIFVLFRTVTQTVTVAATRKREHECSQQREIIGMILLWILTVLLWSPWIIVFASKMMPR